MNAYALPFTPLHCAAHVYDWEVHKPHVPAPSPESLTMQRRAKWRGEDVADRVRNCTEGGKSRQQREAIPIDLTTTVCFRNLPNNYSTKMCLELLDENGFKDSYDFIYVPHDFKRLPTLTNIGYFFVNFVSHELAVSALAKLVGFKNWKLMSNKVLTGAWAAKTQGKLACIERCKYFTFMYASIPNECKPMMFDRGRIKQEYLEGA
jgi:hypothetical protein